MILAFTHNGVLADTGVDSILVRPQRDRHFWSVRDSESGAQPRADLSVSTGYDFRPFQVKLDSGPRLKAIEHRWLTHLSAGGVFIPHWQVNLDVPIATGMLVYDPQTLRQHSTEAFTMGDVELSVKRPLYATEKWGFAVAPFVRLPSGDSERFMGTGNGSGGALLIADCSALERWRFSFNAGLYFRRPNDTVDAHSSSQIPYAFGASYQVRESWQINMEFIGNVRLTKPFKDGLENPLQGLLVARHVTGIWTWTGGSGVGIVRGSGSPYFNLFAGINVSLKKE